MKSSPNRVTNLKLTFAILGLMGGFLMEAHGQSVDLTSTGTPILGLIGSDDYSKAGLAYSHDSDLARLDDGATAAPDLTTWADTFNTGAGNYDSSFVGFTFSTPRPDAISSLTVTFMLIHDGGWFGKNTASGPLTEIDLVLPKLQITTDGTTWTEVPYTSDYTTKLIGQDETIVPYLTPKVTFTPKTPIKGAKGIRLVGPNGGGSGFIAIADERVFGGAASTSTTPPAH